MARRDFFDTPAWRNSLKSPYDPDYDDRLADIDAIYDAYVDDLEDKEEERRYGY